MIKWRPNILWYKYHIAGLSHLFLKFRLIHKAKPYYMPNAKKKKKLKNNSKLLTIKGWANAYHENTNSKKAGMATKKYLQRHSAPFLHTARV